MYKLLLSLFIYILVVLVFPVSEAFAECSACPTGTFESGGQCFLGDGSTRPKTAGVCPAGQKVSPDGVNPTDAAACTCVADPRPPNPPCTGSDCTKGGGLECSDGITTGKGIKTAIGCIPTEPKSLVEGILKFATLGAGGVAFLLMILGALGLITAEGNPEAVKKSQERFYSAIVGLLFVIFSVLLMQLIGVDILGLPGFGKRF